MKSLPLGLLPLALLAAALVARGAGYPPIAEIAFEGNEVTRPQVMLREMVVKPGDPADPAMIERSRQAVQDLGLFRKVELREESTPQGLRLVFVVEERYYLLPLPRFDVNSDGQYAYGAQLRWSNVAGLNHTARLHYEQRDRAEKEFGRETSVVGGYFAPFIFGTRVGAGVSALHSTRPVEDGPLGPYEERFVGASVLFTRALSRGPASQGWTLGAGLNWLDQSTSGEFAEPSYGTATGVLATASWRDLHYHVFSDTGAQFYGLVETAAEGVASDYDYVRYTANYRRYMALGDTPHQTWHVLASAGMYHGGPDNVEPFELGGAGGLRGYENDFIEGDAFYQLALEYARPLFRDWLRGVLILEGGNVYADPSDFGSGKVYSSIGLGLRVRFIKFVDLEVELGWAFPLTDREEGGRFFASRI